MVRDVRLHGLIMAEPAYTLEGTIKNEVTLAFLKPKMIDYVKDSLKIDFDSTKTTIDYMEDDTLEFKIEFF